MYFPDYKELMPAHNPLPAKSYKPCPLMSGRMVICFFVFVAIVITSPFILEAAESSPPENSGIMDFEAAVKTALNNSQVFRESALEIDIKRLDESDSLYSFIPSVTLTTSSYINTDPSGGKPGISIGIVSGRYQPLESYFSLKATKLLTRMAALGHARIISEGILAMAQHFLQLEAFERLAEFNRKKIEISQEKLKLFRKKTGIGAMAPLEVKLAQNELDVALAEAEALEAARVSVWENLRYLMGLDPEQMPDLDLIKIKQQLTANQDQGFGEEIKVVNSSYEMKIQEIREQLQDKQVSLAYAQFVPDFSFGVRNPDPLGDSKYKDDFFISIGISVPLWMGMKRINNITRQKIRLKQTKSQGFKKRREITDNYAKARSRRNEAAVGLKLTRSKKELARLRTLQSEILYKSNAQPLSTLLDAQSGHIAAQKDAIQKELNYNLALLGVKHLTGDLFSRYVTVESFDEKK